MSNLLEHAKRELEIAGIKGSEYDNEVARNVLELIEVFSKQEHSGFSKCAVLQVFNTLVEFKNLKPLSNNPEEWTEVTKGLYISKRNPACFSDDELKTYYDTSEGDYPKTKVVRRLQEYEG
ncbi:MAG: hypothetical protein IKU37_08820 [Candidatus Gastranaerophilales bacterium]|nr:hypothetical protein [Candidatus Gastranaerophilales bacterium]